MPELIGAAILESFFGATAATATFAGVSLATAVGSVTLIGGVVALQALTSPDQSQKVASQQFSSRQALPPRQRGYGRIKIAGPKVAYDSVGGSFYNAVYHSEGPIDGYESWYLDDTVAGLAPPALSGPSGVNPWQAQVQIEAHLGTDDQVASPLLTAGLAYWTADHRLAGCAYTVVKSIAPAQKTFVKAFPGGRPPDVRAVFRAAKVRDVRYPDSTTDPATWTWSDRSGPCLYDFLTHARWGMAVPDELMNQAAWQAFNALSDEGLTTKAGLSVPRYQLAGLYLLTDDPADTLTAMLATCDGRLTLEPDGTIGITGGAMPVPTVTLRDPGILSLTIEVGSGKLATFNRLKTSFLSPPHDYQQTEGDPWDDLQAQDYSGEILEQDFPRPWVMNHNQLRRLAKIYTAKNNPDFRITSMITDLSGAPALFEDAIGLVLTEYGIDAVFLVERAVANVGAGTCTFDLTSLRSDTYAFDAETEEGIAPAIPGATAAASPPDAPVDLTAAIERRAVNGGTNATFLRLTADTPARDDLSLVGRYRRIGDAAWLDMVADGASAFSVVSSVLIDGTLYEAQGAIETYGGALQSDWTATSPATITATADPNAPLPPTGFTASSGPTLGWINPNSVNVAATRILRATGSTAFADATAINTLAGSPNQVFSGVVDGARPPGTYSYWLVALNGSGLPSAPVGPQTVIVT